MTITDALKNSVLEGFTTSLSTADIILGLAMSLAAGLFILLIYRQAMRRVAFNRSFCITLLLVCAISAMVVLTITSNLALSLGMVGALSIVRFRTAVKDPMDLAFLFWAISTGIICGASLYEVALVSALVITIVMLGLHFLPNARPALLLLVSGTDPKLQSELERVLKANTAFYKIKSRNVSAGSIDMIVELKTKEEMGLVEKVMAVPNVERATLMTHDGEVTY